VIVCGITNRHLLRAESLLDAIARNLRAGMTWVQIREKDLTARELFELARAAKALPNPHGAKLIVNSRVDVALAAGADGAHFPALSPEPRRWRAIVPAGFLLGVSCHTTAEVADAESGGADYALFGPVFGPLSKGSELAPRGLEGLAEAERAVKIPVLALGGITWENSAECVRQGAAGVAGITLFASHQAPAKI
jgi:thiamine-phosphate pyrophosphorylase